MKKKDPASRIQDLRQFGEFGGVNPSITDSSTYTFLEADTMEDTFHGETQGCFLYSRHWNPSNKYLADALAALDQTAVQQHLFPIDVQNVTGTGDFCCSAEKFELHKP